MREQEPSLNPPGMQAFLSKLSRVNGSVTVRDGMIVFPDGTTADLKLLTAGGVTSCWHCGALMNQAQRYICGCPKCTEAGQILEMKQV